MVAGLARDSRVFHQRRGINSKAFHRSADTQRAGRGSLLDIPRSTMEFDLVPGIYLLTA
jgi:hypothetical protein